MKDEKSEMDRLRIEHIPCWHPWHGLGLPAPDNPLEVLEIKSKGNVTLGCPEPNQILHTENYQPKPELTSDSIIAELNGERGCEDKLHIEWNGNLGVGITSEKRISEGKIGPIDPHPERNLEIFGPELNENHYCTDGLPRKSYGLVKLAIHYCIEDAQKRFWVGNDEYVNQVNYCPFCGAKASMQIEGNGDQHFQLCYQVKDGGKIGIGELHDTI